MILRRIITCAVTGKTLTEETAGEGFKGWGQIQGVELNGEPNPCLCPQVLSQVMQLVDKLAEEQKSNGVDKPII